jgi:hypothetical protein
MAPSSLWVSCSFFTEGFLPLVIASSAWRRCVRGLGECQSFSSSGLGFRKLLGQAYFALQHGGFAFIEPGSWNFVIWLTIYAFLALLYVDFGSWTCDCNNTLKLPEDTSYAHSNPRLWRWIVWVQVRVASSCSFLMILQQIAQELWKNSFFPLSF